MNASPKRRRTEAQRCTEAMRDLVLGFRSYFEDELRDTGVTLSQLRMLKAIEQQTEVSAATIARHCQVTPQTLHAMLARAVREGWITRGVSERNHRFVTAALTAQGHAILQHGLALKERLEARIWHGVKRSALRATRETLESVNANLHQARSEPDPTTPHPKQ